MSTVPVRFTSSQAQCSTYAPQTPQSTKFTQQPHIKDMRMNMTHQISQIDTNPFFAKPDHGDKLFNKTFHNYNNPEITYSQSQIEMDRQTVVKSSKQIMSISEVRPKRRNTFLTVVSRLPQCKKRSDSLF